MYMCTFAFSYIYIYMNVHTKRYILHSVVGGDDTKPMNP